jgi:hypothetical protein
MRKLWPLMFGVLAFLFAGCVPSWQWWLERVDGQQGGSLVPLFRRRNKPLRRRVRVHLSLGDGLHQPLDLPVGLGGGQYAGQQLPLGERQELAPRAMTARLFQAAGGLQEGAMPVYRIGQLHDAPTLQGHRL